MAERSRLFICIFFSAMVGCADDSTGPVTEQYSKDDLIGYWEGTLSQLVIVKDPSQLGPIGTLVRARPGYVNLFVCSDSRAVMKLGDSLYVLATYYAKDTVQASYLEWGKWKWDPGSPGSIFFDSARVDIVVEMLGYNSPNSYLEKSVSPSWSCSIEYRKPLFSGSGYIGATLKLKDMAGKAAFTEFNLEKIQENPL